jgi:hypothetical protein
MLTPRWSHTCGTSRAAIVASGLFGAPALALYARAIRRGSVGTARPEGMEELDLDEV